MNHTEPGNLSESAAASPSLARNLELLAPAGNWECARAAIENGADAIYFGLDCGFNARARATNFHIKELRQLMAALHRQNVRGYVTLNTLVFTDELYRLESHVRELAAAAVDAVLVQDLGVARFIRKLCPDLVLHASTQMTLTNAKSIEMARELGISRAVLARELSIDEIRKIHNETTMPLEVFVHGALCVAYSGQCLTSESLGGRSANRGQCAQACRLPYELLVDGEPRDLGQQKYLLSPQDLAAHDLIPQLIGAGVCSMKIEGRLKTPEYVANVCSHYRQAIDAAVGGTPRILSEQDQRELELSFSRGFSPGWLEGCDHKRLVPGLTSAKQGVLLGVITDVWRDSFTVNLRAPIAPGDGIVIEGDRLQGKEIGGRVYELFQNRRRVDRAESGLTEISLQRGIISDTRPETGLKVFKTDDPQLTKRLRRTFEGADPEKRVPIDLKVFVAVGEPIRLSVSVQTNDMPDQGQRHSVQFEVVAEHMPEEARKHPIDIDRLREQFSRLGGSVYSLQSLDAEIVGNPMVPLSVLGAMRHELVERLEKERTFKPLACVEKSVVTEMLDVLWKERSQAEGQQVSAPPTAVTLRLLCRSLSQLTAALESGAKSVIADFHDLRQYSEAIETARKFGAEIELATLRIHKPGEDGFFKALAKQTPDRWLVRNLAALAYCREHNIRFACDFSLNATNPLTVEQLLAWGAERVTISYDMNRDQLLELARSMATDRVEVVVHQHMPMFHMEHCVFCSVLSPGKNKSDCGRPCDHHEVKLVDRVGEAHVLHADIGCRNTLYNARAQSGAEAVKPLMEEGIRQFRIELLSDLSAEEVAKLLELYQGLIDGRVDGAEVWRQLKADNRVGITRGTMEQARNPLAIL